LKEQAKTLIRKIPGPRRIARAYKNFAGELRVRRQMAEFARMPQSDPGRLSLLAADSYFCLQEDTGETAFDRHYIFHTAWAARVLAKTRPVRHIDVGSSLYFSAITSAFVDIEFLDYRPADLGLKGLASGFGDLLALPYPDNSIASLSCMHVIEHVGLGRYSDPLDPDGDLKSLRELERVVAPRGQLLLVVPLAARPRIEFNAHRIYSYRMIIDACSGLELRQFALIPDSADDGNLVLDADPKLIERQNYACGCFWFEKKA
jgi:SAM-dependent methyltransferase